jgi:hypothetical protein
MQPHMNIDAIIKKINSDDSPRVIAFILYSEADIELVQLLKDDIVWSGLNEISGERFSIINFTPSKSHMDRVRIGRKIDPDLISGMSDIEYNSTSKHFFQNLFKDTIIFDNPEIDFPGMLYLQGNQDDILDCFYIRFVGSTKAELFNELKAYISSTKSALNNIQDQYLECFGNIYEVVKGTVESKNYIFKLKYRIKQIIPILKLVKSLA